MNRLQHVIALTWVLLGLQTSEACFAAPYDQQRSGNPDVEILRGFVSVGYGQLHYRTARPTDPELIRHRPVLCFHQTPNSSQVFIELMNELATDRVVYAVDTPGLGESDIPPDPPEMADYARAMAEFARVKQLQEFDVVGYHTGASIAAEMAATPNSRIAHLILVGLALFDGEERQGFFAQPWPRPSAKDGSHLLEEWQRSFKWRGAGQTDASVVRTFVQKLEAGDKAWWGARAVMRHDLQAVLADLSTPTVVVNSRDDLYAITPRVKKLRPDIPLVRLDQWGFGIFEVQPVLLADLVRKTFD